MLITNNNDNKILWVLKYIKFKPFKNLMISNIHVKISNENH